MKKIVALISIILAISICFVGCSNNNNRVSTTTTEANTTKTKDFENTNDDEKETPITYIKKTSCFNREDLTTNSYSLIKEDLTFGDILNDKHFSNIKWDITGNETVYLVRFEGSPKPDTQAGKDYSLISVIFFTKTALNGSVSISEFSYFSNGEKSTISMDSTSQATMTETEGMVFAVFQATMATLFSDIQADSLKNTLSETTTESYYSSPSYEQPTIREASGTIKKNTGAFPDWCIELEESINIRENDEISKHSILYFYNDTTLNNLPLSEYEGQKVSISGELENYRDGGEYFINRPTLLGTEAISTEKNISFNFECEKRTDWYDDGIFSGFVNDTIDLNDGTTWEYIGSNYSDFSVSEYDYYNFDIYEVNFSDNTKKYYLVPINTVFPAPTVYEYQSDNSIKWVWSALT